MFADWASGVCQTPDLETINKHISAMVDAIFKHYDYDKDAYISRSEFKQIASNFPFFDSFFIIDLNKLIFYNNNNFLIIFSDGKISKSEMKAYFLELNKKSSKFRSGFEHNFYENTFLTPTICGHCKKIVNYSINILFNFCC